MVKELLICKVSARAPARLAVFRLLVFFFKWWQTLLSYFVGPFNTLNGSSLETVCVYMPVPDQRFPKMNICSGKEWQAVFRSCQALGKDVFV